MFGVGVFFTNTSNTITDFEDGTDKISVTGLFGSKVSFGQLTISSSGSNTLISYNLNNSTLATLTGVNSSLITSADFVTI